MYVIFKKNLIRIWSTYKKQETARCKPGPRLQTDYSLEWSPFVIWGMLQLRGIAELCSVLQMRLRVKKRSKASGRNVQTIWTELSSWRHIWKRQKSSHLPSLSKWTMTKGQSYCMIQLMNSPPVGSVGALLTKMSFDRNDSDDGDNSEKKKLQNQLQGMWDCLLDAFNISLWLVLFQSEALNTNSWFCNVPQFYYEMSVLH